MSNLAVRVQDEIDYWQLLQGVLVLYSRNLRSSVQWKSSSVLFWSRKTTSIVVVRGYISLLLPSLLKLPSQCYQNGSGNFGNLCSNEEIRSKWTVDRTRVWNSLESREYLITSKGVISKSTLLFTIICNLQLFTQHSLRHTVSRYLSVTFHKIKHWWKVFLLSEYCSDPDSLFLLLVIL